MPELASSNLPQNPISRPSTAQPTVSVLIVDDQPIIAESVRRLLSAEADITVSACNDPTLALSIATELKPTVILQDLVMPDVDGLMLVKFFRAHPVTKEIPIMVLSSKEDAQTKAAAFAAGANDYLVKLPDPIELIARLRYHSQAYQNLLQKDEAEKTLIHNKVLEEKVEERTLELQRALDNLKQAQAKLIHSEKMTSMGQLVAGIAHEVNNPINFIYGNLNYMNGYVQDLLELIETYREHYPTPDPSIDEKLEELDLEFTSTDLLQSFVSLRNGAKRIRDLVMSLRNFSRFDEAELKRVDIHQGIDSTLTMLSAQLANVKITKDYGDLPKISCYAGQLNQAIMNIVVNSIEALSASNTGTHPPTVHISTSVSEASSEKVSIWIADNGPGIPLNIQEKIFDPFFTTKEVGEGTGLGLSITHQIITAQHGGILQCYSMPGQGSKFLIEIPVSQSRKKETTDKKTDDRSEALCDRKSVSVA